jgi:hypothetical protein
VSVSLVLCTITTIPGCAGRHGSGLVSTWKRLGPRDGHVEQHRTMAMDNIGNVYLLQRDCSILKVPPSGKASWLVGPWVGSGKQPWKNMQGETSIGGMAVDRHGNVFVAYDNAILKVTPTGQVSNFAGVSFEDTMIPGSIVHSDKSIGWPENRKFTVWKDLLWNNKYYARALPTEGANDGTGKAARFRHPDGLAVDSRDNVYVADRGNHRIRKISPRGVVTTMAAATTDADFDPTDIAVDSSGTIYGVDYVNNCIRAVTKDGDFNTIVQKETWVEHSLQSLSFLHRNEGSFAFPPQKPRVWYYSQPASGVAVDAAGNVYLTNKTMGLILKVTRKDKASHSTRHSFINLDDIGFEIFGVLVVFRNGKDGPREESEWSTELTTIAGQDGTYRSRDGDFASATFREPTSLAVSRTGDLYVLEPAENQIRKIRFPKSNRR